MKRILSFVTALLTVVIPSVVEGSLPLSLVNGVMAATRNDVVVSAFMADPVEVSDSMGEWLQLSNRTDRDIDLSGWMLTDGDRDAYVIDGLVLAAHGVAALCQNSDTERNGGVACDVAYGNQFQMKNDGDWIVLVDNKENEVSRFAYSNYWVVPGKVTTLRTLFANNGTFKNWEFLDLTPISISEPIAEPISGPIVSTVNSSIGTGTLGDVMITEFMADPTDVGDEAGEWVELYNATNHTINLNGWTLTNEAQGTHTISVPNGEFRITSGQYVTLCRSKNYLLNGGVACNYEYGDAFQMMNDSGAIALKDTKDNMISRVLYNASWVQPGKSTALKGFPDEVATYSNLDSWTSEQSAAVDASGRDMGTPGRRNSPDGFIKIFTRQAIAGDFPAALPKGAYLLGGAGVQVDDNESFGEATDVTYPIDVTLKNYIDAGEAVTILGWDSKNKNWETVGNESNLQNGQLRVFLAHGTTLAFVSTDVLAPYLFEVVQKPAEEQLVQEPAVEMVQEETPVVTPPVEVPVEVKVVKTVKKIFTDVSPLFWAYDYIKALKDAGVIHGYPDGKFRPLRFTNRAEMAKIALRAFDQKPHVGMHARFLDVSQDAWFAPYIEKARLLGVIQIDDGRFQPERMVTKAEALALVLRASRLKLDTKTIDTVAKDVRPSNWSYGYVRFAEETGIINAQTKFYPNKPASRADVAAITARILQYTKKAPSNAFFSDYEEMKVAMGK